MILENELENSSETQVIQQLSRIDFPRFFLYLLGDYLLLGLGFAVFAFHPSAGTFLLASVVAGLAQHGLAVLGHEAVHFRICSHRRLNDWIGALFCFFPEGITVSTYREFHLPHHRAPYTEQDPEVPLRRAMGKNWVPPYGIARGMKLWGLSFLGLSLKELWIFLKMLPLGSMRERLGLIAYWSAIGLIAYRTQTMVYLGIWSVGLMTTYFSMLRIQGWYEHGIENSIETNRYSLSSIFHRLIFPHNIWVHYEHHKYPSIPFYNLEKMRELDQSDKVLSIDQMVRALGKRNIPLPNSEQASLSDDQPLSLSA